MGYAAPLAGDDLDGVAGAEDASLEDARVDAAEARVKILVHAVEVATGEPTLIGFTGRGVAGHLNEDIAAEAEADAGHDEIPIEPFRGDVLTGGAGGDGVAFGSDRGDAFNREEAEGALGAAVVLAVIVAVTFDAEWRNDGFEEWELGDATT